MSDPESLFDAWQPEASYLPDLWLPVADLQRAFDEAQAACASLADADDVEWASAAAELYRAELAAMRDRVVALVGRLEEARGSWWQMQIAAREAGQ